MNDIKELIDETIKAFKDRDDPRFKREIDMLERMKERLKEEGQDAEGKDQP